MDEWIDLMLWKQVQIDQNNQKDRKDRKRKCPFQHMVERRIVRVQLVLDFFRSHMQK